MADLTEVLNRLMTRIEYNAHGLEEGDFVRVEYVRNFIEDEKRRADLSDGAPRVMPCSTCMEPLDRVRQRTDVTVVEYFSDEFRLRYPNVTQARAHWTCIEDFLANPERYIA